MARIKAIQRKIRMRTGGVKIKGRLVGGVRLDKQTKTYLKRGYIKIKPVGKYGFKTVATKKGMRYLTKKVSKY